MCVGVGGGILLWELLIKKAPDIAIYLGCSSELDDKTLLLKTTHTLVEGHTETRVEPN